MKKTIILLGLSLLLSACGFKAPTIDPIAEPEVDVMLSWMNQAGDGGGKAYLPLKPTFVAGKAITTDRKGNITVLDAENGGLLWKRNIKEPISSGAGASEDAIFVGTADAEVIAIDIDNGDELWRSQVPNQVLASPQYVNDLVIVKTINGRLLALEAVTGSERWQFVESVPRLILRSDSAPQAAYPFVVSGFSDGKLVLLSADDGKLAWERTIASPSGFSELSRMVDINGEPLIEDGVVYVASYQGNIAAIELRTGQYLWTHELSSYQNLASSPHYIYAADTHGRLWCFNKRTGDVVWRQNDLEGRELTAPAVLDNYVVVADNEGYMHWLDQEDGHFVSRQFFSKKGVIAPPIEYDDMIYVFSRNGTMAALKPKA